MRMLGMDTPELLLIGFVCVLLFGAKKLPELGRSLGVTIKEFKKTMGEAVSGEAAADQQRKCAKDASS